VRRGSLYIGGKAPSLQLYTKLKIVIILCLSQGTDGKSEQRRPLWGLCVSGRIILKEACNLRSQCVGGEEDWIS
jgi:hypothetical protein